MTKLDLTQPVQTRSGLPVRILCTDRKSHQYPIIGLILFGDGTEDTHSWTSEGVWEVKGKKEPHDLDLVNVPRTVTVNGYINVYREIPGAVHPTRIAADRCAGSSRIACVPIHLTVTEGEGI